MTFQPVYFPTEQKIIDFLNAHPFSEDSDAQQISEIIAKTFAKTVYKPEEISLKIQELHKKNQLTFPKCITETCFFLASIHGALEDCVISSKLPQAAIFQDNGKINREALENARKNWREILEQETLKSQELSNQTSLKVLLWITTAALTGVLVKNTFFK